MATEAIFTAQAEQFPPGAVFEKLPEVTAKPERLGPAQDVGIPDSVQTVSPDRQPRPASGAVSTTSSGAPRDDAARSESRR
ncbi:MAG: hypothetical protein ACI8TL_000553 [Natronomonas sp.]|jgi:hypothetical protein